MSRGHAAPLSATTESMLFARARQGDRSARDAIITSNLGYVISVAREYSTGGMSLEEVISEGRMGLLEAMQRFDPHRGVRFLTYGRWWIRFFIQQALAQQAQIVRQPVNRLPDLKRLRATRGRLEQQLGRSPTASEVAEQAGLSDARIEAARSLQRTLSLDAPSLRPSHGAAQGTAADTCEQRETRRILEGCLRDLPAQQRHVLHEHFGLDGAPGRSLSQIGRTMGLTRERVRQIKAAALNELRDAHADCLAELVSPGADTLRMRDVA